MNPGDVIDLMTGYQPAAVIATAVRLGVFRSLAAAPAKPDVVAAGLGTALAPTETLLAALQRLGLAEPDAEAEYHLTEAGNWLAGPDGLALISLKEAFFASVWTRLDDTIRSGRPVLAPWTQRLRTDPDQCRLFLRALRVIAKLTGPKLAEIPALGAGRMVVDIGGGFGSYAVPLARAGAKVRIAELEPVAEWAREELRDESGLLGTLEVIGDDVLMEPNGSAGPADAALVSHVLHDLDDADAVRLLTGTRQRVVPGGQLVLFELAGDSPGTIGPLFDLMMQVEGPGRARTPQQFSGLLSAAGWRQIEVLSPGQPNLIVQAVA